MCFDSYSHLSLGITRDKGDSVLTLLSWVDHFKPKVVLIENAMEFLGYKLSSRQGGRLTLRGGIEYGGLKFLVRTLTALGYAHLDGSYLRNTYLSAAQISITLRGLASWSLWRAAKS